MYSINSGTGADKGCGDSPIKNEMTNPPFDQVLEEEIQGWNKLDTEKGADL